MLKPTDVALFYSIVALHSYVLVDIYMLYQFDLVCTNGIKWYGQSTTSHFMHEIGLIFGI